jgi:hypothetical protein
MYQYYIIICKENSQQLLTFIEDIFELAENNERLVHVEASETF